MAKKKLSTEQKIKNYKKKKRIWLAVRILIAVTAICALIPLSYYGYYYVMFTALPQGSYDPDKTTGIGYSKPLNMMAQFENQYTYILAYYYDGCWHVVDDTQKLKDNRDKFMIYKKDDKWHDGTHLQLILYENSYMLHHIPLDEHTLIDDRCFRDCTKKMDMDEFTKYCEDKGLKVYIF